MIPFYCETQISYYHLKADKKLPEKGFADWSHGLVAGGTRLTIVSLQRHAAGIARSSEEPHAKVFEVEVVDLRTR
jgi:hypothetical protein